MRYTLLISILSLFIFAGCSKNPSSSAPVLKFKSVSTTRLNNQQILSFTLSFTAATGNLLDSIFVQEVVPNCTGSNFDTYYPIPSFPASKNQSGDIVVTFGYNVSGYSSISPQCQENDTATFRFAIRDIQKNTSDTVSSPKIILYYP